MVPEKRQLAAGVVLTVASASCVMLQDGGNLPELSARMRVGRASYDNSILGDYEWLLHCFSVFALLLACAVIWRKIFSNNSPAAKGKGELLHHSIRKSYRGTGEQLRQRGPGFVS